MLRTIESSSSGICRRPSTMSGGCGCPRFFPVLFPLYMLIIVQLLLLLVVAPADGTLVDIELQELRIGQ